MGTAAPFLAVRPPCAAPLRRIGHLRHCSKCPPPRQTPSAGGFGANWPCFGVLQKTCTCCSLSRPVARHRSRLLRFLHGFLPFCHFLIPFPLVLFAQISVFCYVHFAYSKGFLTQKRGRRGGPFGSRNLRQRPLLKALFGEVPAGGKTAVFQQGFRLSKAGEQGVGGVAVAGDAHPRFSAAHLL